MTPVFGAILGAAIALVAVLITNIYILPRVLKQRRDQAFANGYAGTKRAEFTQKYLVFIYRVVMPVVLPLAFAYGGYNLFADMQGAQ